jgi:methylated-DNA-protein-cysteine methyltransferase-like protein
MSTRWGSVKTPAARRSRARIRSAAPLRASTSHTRILAVVARIPRGRVATYGQIARLAGFAGQPRLAGYALHALPDGTTVPWHRVLGAGGRLSLIKLSPAAALTQRLRLEREGVRFDARGRAVMAEHEWRPGSRRLHARRSHGRAVGSGGGTPRSEGVGGRSLARR